MHKNAEDSWLHISSLTRASELHGIADEASNQAHIHLMESLKPQHVPKSAEDAKQSLNLANGVLNNPHAMDAWVANRFNTNAGQSHRANIAWRSVSQQFKHQYPNAWQNAGQHFRLKDRLYGQRNYHRTSNYCRAH